jgi:hypothetical protein
MVFGGAIVLLPGPAGAKGLEQSLTIDSGPPLVERLQRFGLPERPPTPQPRTGISMALPVGFATVAMALALAAGAIRRDPQVVP